jgi:hypothetical protein
MDTAHLAVHGFLLREAVFSQSSFDRKHKNHNQSRCGRKYTFRNARSGEEKRRGQFSERCPWFTFSPAVLADFLTGDNSPDLLLDLVVYGLSALGSTGAHR